MTTLAEALVDADLATLPVRPPLARDLDPQLRIGYWNTTCPRCPTLIPRHRDGCSIHGGFIHG